VAQIYAAGSLLMGVEVGTGSGFLRVPMGNPNPDVPETHSGIRVTLENPTFTRSIRGHLFAMNIIREICCIHLPRVSVDIQKIRIFSGFGFFSGLEGSGFGYDRVR